MRFLVLLLSLVGIDSAFAATISWVGSGGTGGDGNWSSSSAWSCASCSQAAFPSNSASQTFAVYINPALPSNVSLDVNATVDSLTIGANGKITVQAQNALTTGGQLNVNNGAVSVVGGSRLMATGGATGTGSASLYLVDHNTVFQSGADLTGMSSIQAYNGAKLIVQGLLSPVNTFNLDGIATSFQAGAYTQASTGQLGMSNQATGNVNAAFTNNGGKINLQSGSQFTAGSFAGTGNSRVYLTDPNSRLNVTGAMSNGDGTAQSTLQLTNGAAVQVGGAYSQTGTLSADGIGTKVSTGDFSQNSNSSLNLSNQANATVNGKFTNGGAIGMQSGSNLTVTGNLTGQSGSRVILTDPNTVVQVNGSASGGNVQLTNAAQLHVNGNFGLTGSMSLDGIGTGFTTGSFTEDSSSSLKLSNQAKGTVAGDFTNTGGSVSEQSGSSLHVTGNYLGVNDTLSLDGSSMATVDGNFSNSGALNLVFNGSPSLVIGGDITLDGLLNIQLQSGTLPAINTIFKLITFSGVNVGSNFTTQISPMSGGFTFAEIMGAHEIDLEILAPVATPEPSTLTLLFLGLSLGAVGYKLRFKKEII